MDSIFPGDRIVWCYPVFWAYSFSWGSSRGYFGSISLQNIGGAPLLVGITSPLHQFALGVGFRGVGHKQWIYYYNYSVNMSCKWWALMNINILFCNSPDPWHLYCGSLVPGPRLFWACPHGHKPQSGPVRYRRGPWVCMGTLSGAYANKPNSLPSTFTRSLLDCPPLPGVLAQVCCPIFGQM